MTIPQLTDTQDSPVFPYWRQLNEDLSQWDQLYLGDRAWPGMWKVQISKSRSVDKAKAWGKDGYTLTNKGYAGAPMTATGILWRSDQIDDLFSFIAKYDPEYCKIAEPIDVYHPSVALLLVSQVFISKLTITPPGPGALWLTVAIEMDQWFKTTKPAKPIGFAGTALAGSPVNPASFQVGPPKV